MPSKHFARWLISQGLSLALFATLTLHGWADDDNLASDMNDFDDTPQVDDPWGGVVDGVITAQAGTQLAVDDDGHISSTVFGPSVAVGDLNGDGLPDIVMADPRGYFWFYPNSGTPTQPKFTGGEVMPIWIGDPVDTPRDDHQLVVQNYAANNNTVPRIQLVDYSDEKRLSIIAGNYDGKLFYIHNVGTPTQPAFSMPNDLANITVGTYTDNKLWCNFLSPFLYDFTGSGRLDLIVGEGTYASNSIYYLLNRGNNGSPIFNEQYTRKIIPGYGREHLTPQVVDWNHDGKPDIICGDRQGYINLYLNTSTDNDPAHLQFDNPPPTAAPKHVTLGGQEQFGMMTTVTVCDLNNNKLPNLIVSNSDDTISYAVDKGKLGTPDFDLPQPIHGINPLPKIYQAPDNWHIIKSFAMPYFNIVCTNAKDDPDFKGPSDAPTIKAALKMYTVPHKHTYFNNETYPTEDDHLITCTTGIPLQSKVHYDISFWIKTSGSVENARWFVACDEGLDPSPQYPAHDRWLQMGDNVSANGDWTQVKGELYFDPADPSKTENPSPNFFFAYQGNGGTVWLAGFNVKQRAQ